MIVVGIETSCDDTSCAIYDSSEKRVLSNIVSSQISTHAPYGGVVPELASRAHLKNICDVFGCVLSEAGLSISDIEGIAVTDSPGLIGSLLVGMSFAKALAYSRDLPFVGVNHIMAHLLSPELTEGSLLLPCLSLVVSGGHSHLFLVKKGSVSLIARTRDDAAGEAFDKIAKLLGLSYPGGPVIDSLAKKGNPDWVKFPLPKMTDKSLDLSFSGIKTAVLFFLKREHLEPKKSCNLYLLPQWEYDLLASFQRAIVTSIIKSMEKAIKIHKPSSISISGGVACNSLLRKRVIEIGESEGIKTIVPPPKYCSDNGAMVAYAGANMLSRGEKAEFNLDAEPNFKVNKKMQTENIFGIDRSCI